MRRVILAALLALAASCGGNPATTEPAPNPLEGTCWTETHDVTLIIHGERQTYAVTSRWEFLPDAAYVRTRTIPEDQVVVVVTGGYWLEELLGRHWLYTMEQYGGRSWDLTVEEWVDISPRRPETVNVWPGDGTLVVDGVEYEGCP